jgi:hypothetical protein
VFEVGPGFEVAADPSRTKDRGNGAFYAAGWDRAAAKGNHMVLIDTFNYFVEGTAIGESREYGRRYLDITRQKSAAFKATNYATTSTASVTLGATNTNRGVAQDDVAGFTTEADPRGGRRALGPSMFFSVDDSFLLDSAGTVTVTVEYLDGGVDLIDLKYIDVSGREIGPVNRINVATSNTGQFKTASFTLADASFGNRMGVANDLRLDAGVAGGMVIKSLSISRPCTSATPAMAGAPPPPRPAGQTRIVVPFTAARTCLN